MNILFPVPVFLHLQFLSIDCGIRLDLMVFNRKIIYRLVQALIYKAVKK